MGKRKKSKTDIRRQYAALREMIFRKYGSRDGGGCFWICSGSPGDMRLERLTAAYKRAMARAGG